MFSISWNAFTTFIICAVFHMVDIDCSTQAMKSIRFTTMDFSVTMYLCSRVTLTLVRGAMDPFGAMGILEAATTDC
jgi:hypothetical protein